MSLKEHLTAVQTLLSETPFITASSLLYDERPPAGGLTKGTILFMDGSQLDFKEFVAVHPTLLVVKYAYNYRREDRLIFRYDNANDPAAKNVSTFPSHKHIPSGIISAERPSLEEVLREIVSKMNIL